MTADQSLEFVQNMMFALYLGVLVICLLSLLAIFYYGYLWVLYRRV